jgi:hypothetical protein
MGQQRTHAAQRDTDVLSDPGYRTHPIGTATIAIIESYVSPLSFGGAHEGP